MRLDQKILTQEERQAIVHKEMTENPVPKMIIKLAIPTTISMLITSLYNIADTYFVSLIGTSASGAVGVVFPLMAIIQAVGFMLGMGAGSLLSRKLGENDRKSANIYSSTAFYLSFGLGCIITVFGLIFIKDFMRFLGATETILPYAEDYGRYIIWAAPFMCASFVLNNILRSEGKAVFSMIGLTVGGVMNIILDPILIFGCGMGTSGAAIATMISQFVSFLILLAAFVFKKSNISLSISNFSFSVKDIKSICSNGLPSFFRQGLASISTVMLNNVANAYGDSAISAMSIVGKIFMVMLCVGLGIGQGFMPVAGYNYGAKRFDRVRQAYRFTVAAGFVLMGGLALVGFIFAPQIMKLINPDPPVVEIGSGAIRFMCLAMPLQSVIVCTNMILQALGKSVAATVLSCCRQGIFFIPLVYLLPALFDIKGLEATQALADVFTFIATIPFLLSFFKNLKKEEKKLLEEVGTDTQSEPSLSGNSSEL